jgi:hypothetical protein
MARDPLLLADFVGVQFTTRNPLFQEGQGQGATTVWSEAWRTGSIKGAPREILLQAAQQALQNGWVIFSVNCLNGGDDIVNGGKQFDHFVASLGIAVSETKRTFSIHARTPPADEDSSLNQMTSNRVSDPSKTCLAA